MESFETAAPIIVLVCSLTALLFSFIKFYSVKRKSEGTDMMKSISVKIRKGAMAYLKRQYKTVGIFFAIMFFILTVLAAKRFLSPFVPFAFLTGGFFSGLSGYVGMNIATYANTRTANGVRDGLNKGLKIAFASGSVMGLTVVGLGLFDINVWFILLKFVFKLSINDVMTAMLTFGMGASSMALFARVGGGIFTKAADVGAAKSKSVYLRTIRVILPALPIMSAIMSVTLQEWVLICMNRMSARLFRAERLHRRQDLALTVYLCQCLSPQSA